MKKIIKIIAYLVGIVVVVIAGAAIIIPLVVDPNQHKDRIATLVKEQTGRDLMIAGNIDLSVFPWLGISIGEIELGNAPGFGSEPFARIASADVKVKLMPLINREVEVSTVTLKGAHVNLAKNKQGQTNWDDLVAGPPETPSDETAPEVSEPKETPTALAALAIGGIEFVDTRLTWVDESTDTRQSIEKLSLKTGAVELGKPVDVQLAFDLTSNQPPATAHVALKTRANVDLSNELYRLEDTDLTVNFDIKEPANQGSVTITTQATVDMTTNIMTLAALKVLSNVKDQATGITADSQLGTEVTFNLDSQQLSLSPLKLVVDSSGKDIPGGTAQLTLTTDVNADLQQQTLDVANLLIKTFDTTLSGAIKGTQIVDAPVINGELQLAEFSPRELLTKLAQPIPETSDPNVLTKAGFSARFEATPDLLKVNNLVVRLDDSTVTSHASVKNFTAPAVTFDVALDAIDVDRYLPPTAEEEAQPPATPASAAAAGAAEVPMDTLRELNVQGDLKVGNLKVSNMRVSDFLATLNAKDGLIKITPLKAKLYEGVYSGNVQLDARGETLKFTVDENLTGVQAGPLLKDMTGDDTLQGAGNARINVSAMGITPDEVMKSLSGKTEIAFKNGAVKGLNIGKIIRDAKARLKGQPATAAEEAEKTDFAELSASLTFDKGVASNNDLSLKSPLLRVSGKGKVNLIEQTIDYVATTTIVGTSKGQGGKELEELKGLPIDVKVGGTFVEPSFKLDLGSVLKDKAKAEAKKKVEETKQELKDKAKDELQDKLKSFF